MTDINDLRYITMLVNSSVLHDGVDDAIRLMEHLREQAKVIDRYIADPRHPWNYTGKV